jgi:hypothetical protein
MAGISKTISNRECAVCETTDRDVQLIDEFAKRYSLCWSINIHGILPQIVGKDGAFIYVYSEVPALLGVAFCPDELPGNGWNLTIQAALHCGMKILRDCQSEAYLSFNGKDERQASLALAICGATPVRDSAARCALMVTTITAARQRKAKAVEHSRTMRERELELIRKNCDLSDFDHSYQPADPAS